MKLIKISVNGPKAVTNVAAQAFYQRIAAKLTWRQTDWSRAVANVPLVKELQGYLKARMVYTGKLKILRYPNNEEAAELDLYAVSPNHRVYLDDISGNPAITQNNIDILLDTAQMDIKIDLPTIGGSGAPNAPVRHVAHKPVFAYERLTRVRSKASPASVLELFVWKKRMGYITAFMMTNLETGMQGEAKPLANANSKIIYPFKEAVEVLNTYAERSKQARDFVDSSSPRYIPEGATASNWNFVLNTWKGERPEQPTVQPTVAIPEPEVEQETEPQPPTIQKPYRPDLTHLMAQRQDFEGYYTEDIPDYAGDLIGTSTVDASQLAGVFGKTNDAIGLVNKYASGILNNVSFIFNFAKAGAYGVYVPALDRAIKTKALKKQLEGSGYRVEDEDGFMVAYPIDEKKPTEEIQKDIDKLWTRLESQGGSALGINMNNVLNAAMQDVSEIESNIQQQGGELTDPQLLKDAVTLLHLSSTIVHEAIHAQGGDEGAAYGGQDQFVSSILNEINSRYQRDLQARGLENEFTPIQPSGQTRMASHNNWYKVAQYMSNIPSSLLGPKGSDLSGRYGNQLTNSEMAEWGMIVQEDQNTPIEKRLSREYMAPLNPEISQEHNSIEEQLRKQTRNDDKPNPMLIYEELLHVDHDDSASYKLIEELMEEGRPRPLILPLKAASNMMKTATVFGWYNNLEISDGNTIPGLGDRVMAWDDRDEDFSWTEDDTRRQYRYNPTYDIKGFHFRWIEPHFTPQLFDDMQSDLSNTHPAKRFAAVNDFTNIMGILNQINRAVGNGVRGTRLVVSEDLLPLVQKTIKWTMYTYPCEDDFDDTMFSVWVCDDSLDEDEVSAIEKYTVEKEYDKNVDLAIENILGGSKQMANAVEEVIETTKAVCESFGYSGMYAIGAYARMRKEGNDKPCVPEINLICGHPSRCVKIGEEVAERLGVDCDIHRSSGLLRFVFGNVQVDFGGSKALEAIRKRIGEDDPVKVSLSNMDFTVNMFAWDVSEEKLADPLVVANADHENRIVKTLLDPDFVLENNPMVILNAMRFEAEGYEIHRDLKRAMIENAALLLDGRYPLEKLLHARENLRSKGKDIDRMFDKYALWEIKKLKPEEDICQFLSD